MKYYLQKIVFYCILLTKPALMNLNYEYTKDLNKLILQTVRFQISLKVKINFSPKTHGHSNCYFVALVFVEINCSTRPDRIIFTNTTKQCFSYHHPQSTR